MMRINSGPNDLSCVIKKLNVLKKNTNIIPILPLFYFQVIILYFQVIILSTYSTLVIIIKQLQ